VKNGYVSDPVTWPIFYLNACRTAQESSFVLAISGDDGFAQFSDFLQQFLLASLRIPAINWQLPRITPVPKTEIN